MNDFGHNSQHMTPFESASTEVDLLWVEAQNWLDGAAVSTQADADAIGQLLDMARKARTKADESRKVEAQPFDDGKAAVQARYKPLLDRCDAVAKAAKEALAPFLAAQEAAKRAAEAKAREDALAAHAAAWEAFAAGRSVEDRVAAEEAAEAARRADIAAHIASKDRGRAKGGAKAISLRTTIKPEITDMTALMRWIWQNDQSAIVGFAERYVAGSFRAGHRQIDGVRAVEEKIVA